MQGPSRRNQMKEPGSAQLAAHSRGFSLMELMIVCAVFMIVGGISAITLMPAWQQTRITEAYNTTLMVIRRAHDESVAQCRVYVVSFDDVSVPNTVTVTQNTTTGPVLVSASLPPEIKFTTVTGMPTSNATPPTTPDSFGVAGFGVDLDVNVTPGIKTIYFYPTGSAFDNAGNISNGVVYIARPSDINSPRAVTIWGATGRIRGWRLYQSGTQYSWGQL